MTVVKWLVLPAAAAQSRRGDRSPSGRIYGEPLLEAEGATPRRAAFAFSMTDEDEADARDYIRRKASGSFGIFDRLPKNWQHLELI